MRFSSAALILFLGACATAPEQPGQQVNPMAADETQDRGVTQITHSGFGNDRDPAMAPDGKTLVYATDAFSRDLDIYSKELDSTTVRPLVTNPGSDERFPAVNPRNPNMIAFASNREGEWHIYLIADLIKAPNKWIPISEPGSDNIHPSFSPDGSRLVYCSRRDAEGGEWIIKIADFNTNAIYTFEDIDGFLPEWSPVDNRIVFQRMRHRDNYFGGLWVFTFENTRALGLTNILSEKDWAAINPSWSPDGKRIVFCTVGKDRTRRNILTEADDIWVCNADGSNIQQVTFSRAADWMPCFTQDGSILFASNRKGRYHIWRIKPQLQ